jgi:hypothetical protein
MNCFYSCDGTYKCNNKVQVEKFTLTHQEKIVEAEIANIRKAIEDTNKTLKNAQEFEKQASLQPVQ